MAEEDRAWGSVGFGGTRAPAGSRVQGRDGRGWGKKYVAGAVRIADCRNFGEGSGPSPSCCQGSSGRGSP